MQKVAWLDLPVFQLSIFKIRISELSVFCGNPSCQEPFYPPACSTSMMSHASPFTRYRIATTIAFASTALLFTGCGKKDAANSKAPAKTSVSKTASAGDVTLDTDDQRVSYGIGYNIGKDMARQTGLTIDQAALKAGLTDALSSAETRIPQEALMAAFQSVQQRVAAIAAKEGEKNIAVGAEFLAKNKKRAGVKATASGLQYEVLKAGTGPKATKESTVKVHYTGTLLDGTVFDSSVERGEPIEFPVTGVIPGWTEALQLMSAGAKWKLYVPAGLAYGPQARPGIPANSTLIFEVELLEIK